MIIKRELLFLTTLYIIGILLGKFLNWTVSLLAVLFYFSVCLFMIKKYDIKQYVLILASCLCLVIGCFNTLLKSEYNFRHNGNFIGIITEITKADNDKTSYVVRLTNNINVVLNVYTKSRLHIYDKINFYGDVIKPKSATNMGGFNYKDYLISKDIYGVVNTDADPQIIKSDNSNLFLTACMKLKYKVINIIDSTSFGVQREIFKGIILGETGGFSDEMKNDFMNAGLTHLLAVSGSNVGLITMFILGGFNLIRLNKRLSRVLTIVIIIMFAIITGLTPSVVRASIMAIVILSGYVLMRKPDTLTSIAFSAFIILISNPYTLFDAGFLLTFLGTIGIVLYYRPIYDIIRRRIKYEPIRSVLAMTLAVQIFITPITMYYFNKISLVGFISNIIAIPIASAATLSGFIACCVGLISIYPAQLFSNVAYLFITLLYYISKFFAKFQILNITVTTPNIALILVFYTILLLILKKRKIDFKRYTIYVKYACYVVLVVLLVNSFVPKPLEITFVDVGQGDCIFIRSPEGKTMIIDGGGSYDPTRKYDVGKNIVVPFLLDSRVRKVDTIILTHSHNDHLEGLIDVVDNFKVNNLVYGTYDNSNSEFKGFIKKGLSRGVRLSSAVNGDNIRFSKDISLLILNPQNGTIYDEQNDNSVVAKLVYGKRSILFTGDISENIDKILDERISKSILKCDILKVAHHGSRTSSSQELLDYIRPSVSVISVGKNKFGHPNKEVLKRLQEVNSKVYRTDRSGAVTIKIYKNGSIKVKELNKNV